MVSLAIFYVRNSPIEAQKPLINQGLFLFLSDSMFMMSQ